MKEDTDADPLVTRGQQTVPHAGTTPESHDREATSGSGRLEVRCPNCHAPTEVAADTTLTDLTCSACGSHFSLVDQSKATRMAPPLSKLGRFELIERLGVGGFGSVWKARDKELDRTVAIKIPRAGAMSSTEQEQFFREARAAAQLRHPRIVSVHEVGRDGDSIYIVSDFVRGVTLGDWLTGQQLTCREAADLCAKIADALHHAHEQGIVHRDLKPANIIMDYDGQPHLMDFGLARRESGEITVTMDGQVLGTPAYMSPEQAQGEAHTADRRSDVYSLGVILFQLFTGELPFRGNARMLIKQVIQDEPPSPRKLNSNVGRDLETITLKCLEKDPGRRYPTAQCLEAELQRFLSGDSIQARPLGRLERSWRWAKRNRRVAFLMASVAVLLVTIAALSMIGFAVAKKQQLAAQESAEREANLRGLAEENLGLAEKAVDNYLTRVAEDDRLKQEDFHKLRTELLETAVPFYERFAKQKPDDAPSQANQANAYARLASIHGETGQHQRSVSEYAQAIALRKELTSKYPDVREYQRDLAHNEAELGWDYHVIAKTAEARPHYDAALPILTKLADEFPKDPAYRQMLAKTHERYGMLVRFNDAAAGQKHFERSIALERALVSEYPNEPQYATGLATSSFYLGHLLRNSQPKVAKERFVEAADIQRKLVGARPKDPELRSALAESLANIGFVLYVLGDAPGGHRYYDEGTKIQKQVVAQFPSVVKYRQLLGNIHSNCGNSLATNREWLDAVRQYEQSIEIFDALAADFPDVPMYAQHACSDHLTCANLLKSANDNASAQNHIESALKVPVKLMQDHPDVPAYRRQAADLHVRLATMLRYRAELAASRRESESSLKIREELANDFPDKPEYRNELAKGFTNLGDFLEGLGDIAAARTAYEKGATEFLKLADKFPDKLEYRSKAAVAQVSLGDLAMKRDDSKAARQSFGLALASFVRLCQQGPSNPYYHDWLGWLHKRIAEFEHQQGEWATARKHFEQAFDTYAKMAADFPDEHGSLARHAWSCESFGDALREHGDMAAARQKYDCALAIWSKLSKKAPDSPAYRISLAKNHFRFGELLSSMGDVAGAKLHYDQAVSVEAQLVTELSDNKSNRNRIAESLNSLGWSFATSTSGDTRHGARAVELATKACELTEYKQPYFVDTLAAAYAQSGDFDSAVKWSEKSLDLVKDNKDANRRAALSRALESFKAKKPIREAVVKVAEQRTAEQKHVSEPAGKQTHDETDDSQEVTGQN